MIALPIDAVLDTVQREVRERGVVVVQASPGAGKTTRIPPALLEVVDGDVVVLEPRRVAARMAAARVARELGEQLGGAVGYQVRFDNRTSARTRLSFLTEGVLTRRLMGDPALTGVGCVVLDEIHERHLHGDLAFALLAHLRRRRPQLSLVAMSATLEATPLSELLGASTVRCEGRRYEVTLEHRPPPPREELALSVAKAARELARDERAGHILVFLPGASDIRRASERCAPIARDHDLRIRPLHGQLSARDQDLAVAPSDHRKLILATNVAESSLTIEGVTGVIDSGLHKVARQRPDGALPELRLLPISQASAAQRAGRAGRTTAGRCLRLYAEADLRRRPQYDVPEISRSDLTEVRLALALAGVTDTRALPWLTPPPEHALAQAEATLRAIGALGAEGATPLGEQLSQLPLPPRLGRVLLEARRRGVDEEAVSALSIVAEAGGSRKDASLWAQSERFEAARAAQFSEAALSRLSVPRRARSLERARVQLARAAARLPAGRRSTDRERALEAAFLAGFGDQVAKQVGTEGTAIRLALSAGGSALLQDSRALGPEGYTLVLAARQTSARSPATVELAMPLGSSLLLEEAEERISVEEELTFDEARGRVESVGRMRYDRLVLEESRTPANPSEEVAALLVDAALARGLHKHDAVVKLQSRLAFARQQDASIPLLGDEQLRATLERLATTTNALAELEAMPLETVLLATLGGELPTRLRRLAPDEVQLRNGHRMAVHYPAPDRRPYLASYLQDFFGLAEGPRAGSTALVLELWTPNRRPVQVTSDLAGFWRVHYPELRRQLARRYPKHHWPDNPAAAPAKRLVRQL